ncbi:MAG: mannan-binding lectin [Hyphomonadaceae bacterium]|nr:mannan-binding lectin [Hyphomonadaceae bacterium]
MKMHGVLAAALLVLAGGCATGGAGAADARDFQAGPIWNQADAELKCPVVAYAVGGAWNGQWVTTIANEMSVCGVTGASRLQLTAPTNVEVGPIWRQEDAQAKCPAAAAALGAAWNGHWWTTVWGKMSVCALAPPDAKRD